MSESKRAQQKGVTLVETLVALAVMGLVIAGLLTLVGQNTRFAAVMQERSLAGVVADNLMIEALVLQSARETGDSDGDVVLGGREWRYRRTITQTGVGGVLRVDIEVLGMNTDQVLARATSMRRGL